MDDREILFLGNLPLKATEQDVWKMFDHYKSLNYAWVHVPTMDALVQFTHSRPAKRAYQDIQGMPGPSGAGSHVRRMRILSVCVSRRALCSLLHCLRGNAASAQRAVVLLPNQPLSLRCPQVSCLTAVIQKSWILLLQCAPAAYTARSPPPPPPPRTSEVRGGGCGGEGGGVRGALRGGLAVHTQGGAHRGRCIHKAVHTKGGL